MDAASKRGERISATPSAAASGRFAPSAFLRALPKAELHLHLEGTVAPATLVELSEQHGEAPAERMTLGDAVMLYQYENFQGFLMAFKAVTQLLRTGHDYELITYRMMQELRRQNVLHAEVYVSVGVCLWKGMDFAAVFEGMERGREAGERDFGVSLLWIFDAVRHFGADAGQKVVELAVRYRTRNVVGIGIGGDEARGPAEWFAPSYRYAAEHGLRLTAHAGETTGPESVWGALNLRAERIGHGIQAAKDVELMDVLAERQIPMELCVSSNLQTGACPALAEHPLREFFERGLMVTLNSDDPAMFHTTLEGEYQLVQQHFYFSDEQMRELARNSFEASFLPAERKLDFLRAVDAVEVAHD